MVYSNNTIVCCQVSKPCSVQLKQISPRVLPFLFENQGKNVVPLIANLNGDNGKTKQNSC